MNQSPKSEVQSPTDHSTFHPFTYSPFHPNKWLVLAVLAAAYFLQQGTRQIYNATLPQIKADFLGFGVTDVQLGMVATVFTFVYGLSVPFAGVVADLFRRKWIVVAGVALFSAGVFASGFASSLAVMLVAYGIVNAVGQCMIPAPSTSIIAQYHEKTRATALSIYQSALYAGIVICSCAAGWLGGLGQGGWRWSFWIFGGAGLAVVALIALFVRELPQDVSAEPRAANHEPRIAKPTFRDAVLAIVTKPSAILLTLAFGMCLYGDKGFLTWMTKYFHDAFGGLPPAAAAFHAVFWFYAGALLGINAASRVSDKLAASRPGVRMEMNAAGLVLMAPFAYLTVHVSSVPAACAMLALWGFAHGVYDSNFIASLHGVVPARFRSAAFGIFCCGGFLMGSLSPAVLGWMSGAFSLKAGFSSLAVFYLAGAALVLVARAFFFRRDKTEG